MITLLFIFLCVFVSLGSPFTCVVLDGSKAKASGEGLQSCRVGQRAFFRVDTAGVGAADLACVVTAPSGKNRPVDISGSSQSGFNCEYVPEEIGELIVLS